MVLLLTVFCCNNNKHNPAFQITDPCESTSPTPDSLLYTPVYEKPVITSPNNNSIIPIIYGDEVVEIKWESPKDLVRLELEYFKLDHPYDCLDYEKFRPSYPIMVNGVVGEGSTSFPNNTGRCHYWLINGFYDPFKTDYFEIIKDTVYVAYRMRSKSIWSDPSKKFSLWTDVKTFAMVPLVNLKKDIIEVSYHFNFIAEETHEYYFSGMAKANNYRLNNMASDNHLNLEKIRSIRPVKFVTNFVSGFARNKNPFLLLTIGFNEDYEYKKLFCPFELIGSVAPSSNQESRSIEGQFLETYSNNFLSQMKDYDLKLAYKLEGASGTEQKVLITLTYEVFSDY
ncbi:hypothetical protein [Aestuariivivens insulae]|uniref:hypothetical protein n=1 Tax=Aestuariivivens insulae TaxID=1621988 RepID=UPI001F584426|nr:hypothetical protein [Aestuariivivens insulae]